MSTEKINNDSIVKVVKREGISAVWLVPVIALIFGGYLILKSYMEKGVMITVLFDNASGLVKGKTEVKYKGLTVGKVQDIKISKDMQHVIAEIEMLPGSKDKLTDNTLFWLVTADISIDGVSGLDTLLSGGYINIMPDIKGSGNPQSHFVALKHEPPLDKSLPGLHVILQTDKLGSIHRNAPVMYKQISVGHVSNYKYDPIKDIIDVDVFIEPKYTDLVKKNTRFWNASGFELTGSLTTGLEVKTQSMASILSGGIAFDELEYEHNNALAESGDVYQLFADYSDAEMGYQITLNVSLNAGIDIGAPIVYEGLVIGKVEKLFKVDPVERMAKFYAKMNPRVSQYLTSNSQLFVVKPEIDLSGVNNISALFMGAHIGIRPAFSGDITTEFLVYNEKPPFHYTYPGLHLQLNTQNVESIKVGSNIFYKQQAVGSVQKIENSGPDNFTIHAYIKPEYKSYITTNTKFWNSSGVRLTGDLQGFELRAQSVQNILSGGIAFDHSEETPGKTPQNGDQYKLYENKDVSDQYEEFSLTSISNKNIRVGTRIMFRGNTVGSIHRIEHKNDHFILTGGLLPDYVNILREQSQFWLVKPQISLSGLSDTDALFGGAYISFHEGEGAETRQFNLLQKPPAKPVQAEGLQLVLNARSGSVVSPSSPISYRGILVGQVDNVVLDKTGENVAINITIDEEYQHLISSNTRFYNASGITVSGGIGNIMVNAESVDSILKGGISFYSPTNESKGDVAIEGEAYTLFDSLYAAESAGIAVTVHFKDIGGLRDNMKVKYQDQTIGFVERLSFDNDSYGATALLFLNDNGRKFAVKGSKFWLAKLELGLVGSRNVSTLVEGDFIKILPGNGEQSTEFIAEDLPPVITMLPHGLNIQLTTPQLGSVREGNPVLYRQVQVGTVIGVDLAPMADGVIIYVNITERFASLVTSESVFWNTSGISIDAGMFSGVKIETESVETILSGGIAFSTPKTGTSVSQGASFDLATEFNEEWHQWRPQIAIGQ